MTQLQNMPKSVVQIHIDLFVDSNYPLVASTSTVKGYVDKNGFEYFSLDETLSIYFKQCFLKEARDIIKYLH